MLDRIPSSRLRTERRSASEPTGPTHSAERLCYLPSHLLTFAWCAEIHFCAALSGLMWSPAMYFATDSWSVFDQLNRLSTAYAGEPLFENFALNTLLRTMWSYAHLYFATLPPAFASSWQPLKRFGSITSESLYWRFRYCGVYQ